MNDVAEAEAVALLSSPLTCPDAPDWEPVKLDGTRLIQVGALDHRGFNARLLVQLVFKESHKTRRKSYTFSVFKRQLYGLERVYQLSVEQWATPISDVHKRSHEHFGDRRTIGLKGWEYWTFNDVLAYFCRRTNIAFDPPIPDPEHFALSGGKK
jgi:hypothetical protein